MKGKERLRQALFFTLCTIGFLAFCTLGSDDIPGREMTLGYFISSKAVALTVLLACMGAIRLLNRKGLITPPEDNSKKWED